MGLLNKQCARLNSTSLLKGLRRIHQGGFTLIEFLVVIIIAGLMAAGAAVVWGEFYGKINRDIQETRALSEMDAIRDAIETNFYGDLNRIPCDEEFPQYAFRFLTFSPDKKTMSAMSRAEYRDLSLQENFVKCDDLQGTLKDLCLFLGRGKNPSAKVFLLWNKYYLKGWRGGYAAGNDTFQAEKIFPEIYGNGDDGPVLLQAMASPWADICEEKAIEAEAMGKKKLAAELRKGKFYQIISMGSPDTSLILCRGPDCLPGPVEAARECAEADFFTRDCIKDPLIELREIIADYVNKQCGDLITDNYGPCNDYCDKLDISSRIYQDCMKNNCNEIGLRRKERCTPLCQDAVWSKCTECVSGCGREALAGLKITDPDDKNYIDVGDDVILFLITGIIRSPMEK